MLSKMVSTCLFFSVSVLSVALFAHAQGFGQDRHSDTPGIDLEKTIAELASPDPKIRGMAACRLGEAKADSVIRPLAELLADSSPIDVVACGERGRFSSYEPPGSSSPGMEAAKSLGAIGKNLETRYPLLALLYESLASGRPHAAENAALALGIIGDAMAVKPLLASLDNHSESVVLKAIWALAAIKDSRAVLPFIDALSDESAAIREKAAWALSVVRDDRAVLPLVLAAVDEVASVRERAVYALGTYHDPRVVSPLVNALDDAQASVRERAAWGLGSVKAAEAVVPLIGSLNDQSAGVRQRAAWALGVIKDERALPALRDALNDSDPKVRKHAREAVTLIEREASRAGINTEKVTIR